MPRSAASFLLARSPQCQRCHRRRPLPPPRAPRATCASCRYPSGRTLCGWREPPPQTGPGLGKRAAVTPFAGTAAPHSAQRDPVSSACWENGVAYKRLGWGSPLPRTYLLPAGWASRNADPPCRKRRGSGCGTGRQVPPGQPPVPPTTHRSSQLWLRWISRRPPRPKAPPSVSSMLLW